MAGKKKENILWTAISKKFLYARPKTSLTGNKKTEKIIGHSTAKKRHETLFKLPFRQKVLLGEARKNH